MKLVYSRMVIAGLVLFLALGVWPSPTSAAGIAPTSEEFVGPFQSWVNLKKDYGAAGNGSSDDTSALQKALDDLGQGNNSRVLYIPAGTYLISRNVILNPMAKIGIVGEDPRRSIIKWNGPNGGNLLTLSGVAYSKINRLTFDGNRKASVLVDEAWSGSGNYFDNMDEYADDIFQNAEMGIRGGNLGAGANESAVWRCQFLNLTKSGISLQNPNALDWSIYDSYFENNYTGLTNQISGANGSVGGNFQVYRSVFKNSSFADIDMGPTEFFAFRNNISIGSNYFFHSYAVGTPAAPLTFEGNTIIDPKSGAILALTPGSVSLLNNTIRSSISGTVHLSESWSGKTGTTIALGNTFTNAKALDVPAPQKLIDLNNKVVDPSSVPTPSVSLPVPLPNYNRQVFEVPAGSNADSIQDSINKASQAGNRAVVHLPSGTYPINKTLIIPSGSDIQLVGDGGNFATYLYWSGDGSGPVLKLFAPSHATLRDFYLSGKDKVDGVVIEVSDLPGDSVYADQAELWFANRNNVLVNGLSNAKVNFHMLEHYASKGVGLKVVGNGNINSLSRVNVFQAQTSGNNMAYDVSNGGKLLVQDNWLETGKEKMVNLTGSGEFVADNGNIVVNDPAHGGDDSNSPGITIDNFSGRVGFSNINMNRGSFLIKNSGSNLQFLANGIIGPLNNNSSYLSNSSPASQVALINSRRFLNDGGGTGSVPDESYNVSSINSFVQTILSPVITEQLPALGPVATGNLSDVRLFRVFIDNGINSLVIQPASGGVQPPSQPSSTPAPMPYTPPSSSDSSLPVPVTFSSTSNQSTFVSPSPEPAISPSALAAIKNLDLTPPQISITSPVISQSGTGPFVFSASASDNIGVAEVKFLANGKPISRVTSQPYQVQFDPSSFSGLVRLIAVAKDGLGNAAVTQINLNVYPDKHWVAMDPNL